MKPLQIFIYILIVATTFKDSIFNCQVVLTKDILENQEMLAELYYNHQKNERLEQYRMQGDFPHINANFPCLHGVTVLGVSTVNSIKFGHKYACGLHVIKNAPIVYSFGSNKKQDFELSVLNLRPDSKIFVYEIDPGRLTKVPSREYRISYNAIGLGYNKTEKFQVSSLYNLMKMNNHKYIDILKMDIEGHEWTFLQKESHLLRRVGQLLVEIHAYKTRFSELGIHGPMPFINKLEILNFRLFHKEGNFLPGKECCSEWSFIHKNWTRWEESKLNFPNLRDR